MENVDNVVISGLDRDLSKAKILDALRIGTTKRILDFFLVRGDAVVNPPAGVCEAGLVRELLAFLPKRNQHGCFLRVHVYPASPKDSFMKVLIAFDASLHLESTKAMEQIQGKVLPGCLP